MIKLKMTVAGEGIRGTTRKDERNGCIKRRKGSKRENKRKKAKGK